MGANIPQHGCSKGPPTNAKKKRIFPLHEFSLRTLRLTNAWSLWYVGRKFLAIHFLYLHLPLGIQSLESYQDHWFTGGSWRLYNRLPFIKTWICVWCEWNKFQNIFSKFCFLKIVKNQSHGTICKNLPYQTTNPRIWSNLRKWNPRTLGKYFASFETNITIAIRFHSHETV